MVGGSARRSTGKDKWARWAVRGATALVALVLLAHIAQQVDPALLLARLVEIGPIAVVVLVPALFAAVAQTVGLRGIVRRLGTEPRWWPLLRVRLTAEALCTSLPGGGAVADAASVGLLGRELGMSRPVAIATIAGRKFLVVLTNGGYAAVALLVGGGSIATASAALGLGDSLWWLVLGAGVALAAAALVGNSVARSARVGRRVRNALSSVPSHRLRAWLDQRADGFLAMDDHLAHVARTPGPLLALSSVAFLAAWLVEALETWLILFLLGAPATFGEVLAIEVVVSLLRSAAFAIPGGLGVQDAGHFTMLSALSIPGGPAVGVALVLLKRAKDLCWVAVGLGLFLLARARPMSGDPTPANAGSCGP